MKHLFRSLSGDEGWLNAFPLEPPVETMPLPHAVLTQEDDRFFQDVQFPVTAPTDEFCVLRPVEAEAVVAPVATMLGAAEKIAGDSSSMEIEPLPIDQRRDAFASRDSTRGSHRPITPSPGPGARSIRSSFTAFDGSLMEQDCGTLRALVLGGFGTHGLNALFVERQSESYRCNGRETYWSEKGDFCIFFNEALNTWAAEKARRFSQVRAQRSNGIAYGPKGFEILCDSEQDEWNEWDKEAKVWVRRPSSGVSRRGRVRVVNTPTVSWKSIPSDAAPSEPMSKNSASG
jgi:hypothetical protein